MKTKNNKPLGVDSTLREKYLAQCSELEHYIDDQLDRHSEDYTQFCHDYVSNMRQIGARYIAGVK